MRRALITLLATVLAAGTLSLAASPASAAPAVRISAPKPAVAPYLGTTTVKPRVTKSKGVKIVSSRITVKQGSRTVVRSRSSARLKAGSYRVTTVVKYRPSKKAKVRTKKATHRVTVRQGAKNCATPADAKAVLTIFELTSDSQQPHTSSQVNKRFGTSGTRVDRGTLAQMQELWADDPEWSTYFADLAEHFGGSTIWEARDYRRCGTTRTLQVQYLTDSGVPYALDVITG
jgi:hypothetical protein